MHSPAWERLLCPEFLLSVPFNLNYWTWIVVVSCFQPYDVIGRAACYWMRTASNNSPSSMLFSSVASVHREMGLSCLQKPLIPKMVDLITSMKQWCCSVVVTLGDCSDVNRDCGDAWLGNADLCFWKYTVPNSLGHERKPDSVVSFASDPGVFGVSAEINDAWSNVFINEVFLYPTEKKA